MTSEPAPARRESEGRHGELSGAAAATGSPSSAPAAPEHAPRNDGVADDAVPPDTTALEQEPATGRGPGARPARRAGRDLRAATIVGVLLAGVFLASLFTRPVAFVAFVVVAVIAALWELSQAFKSRSVRIPLLPLWVGAAGILVSAHTAGMQAMGMAFLITAGCVFLWRVLDGGGPAAIRDAAAGVFAAAYVPFLAGFAVLLVNLDRGPLLVLVFVACVVANDLGGYVVGVLIGRHPMAPSISPKKSWEGFAGSLGFTAAVASTLAILLLGASWWSGPLLAVAVVVSATVGDLAESLLKRDLGLKDMGTLLPGHGGVMDRLDSLLLTAPAAYLVLRPMLG